MDPEPKDDEGSPARSEAKKLVGRVLSGRYRVLELIAAGGMGAVYRGEHVHMRHRVAIKVLLPQTEGLPELVKRFEREAIAGAHVRHPHVAAATDFGRDEEGNHFLVLELVEGETLAKLMARGPIEPPRATRIARELAAALGAVHEKGIVHRDVKPGNVVLSTEDGSVKLLDFGFAKVDVEQLSEREEAPEKPLTAVDMVLGTVPYMAPEIAKGTALLDARADLYALGIIFYEMLAGKHPFEAATTPQLFAAHCTRPPSPIAVRSPGVQVPPALEAVVMALLAKKPEERFQSAAALLNALDAAEQEPTAGASLVAEPASSSAVLDASAHEGAASSEQSPPAQTPRPMLAPPKRRHPTAVLAAVVGGGVLIGVLSVVLAFSGSEAPSPGNDDSRRVEGPQELAEESSAPAREDESAPSYQKAVVSEVDGRGAKDWRKTLLKAPRVKHWLDGAKALIALAKLEPQAFDEPAVRDAAVSVSVGIATGPAEHADPVFELLAHRLGRSGHEVLWQLVRTKGGTEASSRAVSLLESEEVAARASPALLVALELRRRPCPEKPELFPRAAEVGDERVLQELRILKHAKCPSAHHSCCFRRHDGLLSAIETLEEKLPKR